MNEHPILFSAPMVKAILEGRKTQTRRAVQKNALKWLTPPLFYCPYGQPGDRLWVRETWQRCHECGRVVYQASSNQNGKLCPNCDEWLGPWKPSIHMFREYSRITLEVVSVRVERVQDISEQDAKAEGADAEKSHRVYPSRRAARAYSYRDGFRNLWDSINAKRGFGWDTNPWVWVVEFKRIEETHP